MQITITQKNAQGEMELYWKVSPNVDLGEPRQLAYKLDTLIINRRIDELGRPLPKVLRLDSFKQMCTNLDMTASGRTNDKLKQAFHANAGAYIIAKLRYTATDGTERTLEAGFTRYSVVFTGERLPDGTQADAVYLVLNEPYWEVLNSAPTRPLDYDYLKALTPAAQRCYEILSYKLFAALKYQYPHAKLLYSEYCIFSAQQRYADYPHVKKQMYKVHKPHLASGYLESVRYEATTDEDGRPDWVMTYVPGPKARAEYAAFNTRPRQRPARPAAGPQPAAPAAPPKALAVEAVPAAPSPTADEALTTQAQALVQYFHQRFHGTADVPPSAKALTQARTLLARYGLEQARHLVDFSSTAAQETAYRPQTFGGILQYTARARAAYAQAQERAAGRNAPARSGAAPRPTSSSASSTKPPAPRAWRSCGPPRRPTSSRPLRRPPPRTSTATIPAPLGAISCAGMPSMTPWRRIFSSRPLSSGRPLSRPPRRRPATDALRKECTRCHRPPPTHRPRCGCRCGRTRQRPSRPSSTPGRAA